MNDILARIKTYKLAEVEERRQSTSLNDLETRIAQQSPPRGFTAALKRQVMPHTLALIAEIKKASPSKGLIRADFDPVILAQAYKEGGAACLSVLTDQPSFQGHDTYLTQVRNSVDLPCLRKDFLVDSWQVTESRALGADAILVIMAMVDDDLAADLIEAAHAYRMDALIEVHDAQEMTRALNLKSKLIGINNRNLKTFEVDLKVSETLASMVSLDHCLVVESGIFTPLDVQRLKTTGAKAMLVGESLMRAQDVKAATKALLG
jgi:indole-3-glycerol phosphate synthase